jgi:hypothetical protein
MIVRDYSESREVVADGVRFRVGHVPHGRWRQIALAGADAYRNAVRRSLSRARTQTTPAEYEALTDDERALLLEALRNEDPGFLATIEEMQREAVKWGLRGWEGAPVAFEGAEREYMGRRYAGASDRDVEIVADNRATLAALYVAISEMNEVTVTEKKSSPSPTPTTAGVGPASTA